MQTVRDLHAHADELLFAGEYPTALQAYAALVRLVPGHLDARLRVADTLLAMGEVQGAAVVYTALARHAAHAGYPLRALVALKILSTLEPQLGRLLGGVAELYAKDSLRLGRSARPSLGDPEARLPQELRLGPITDLPALALAAVKLASDTDDIATYPEKLPPMPIFSELAADHFAAVLGALKLVRTRPGDTILAQGDEGQSFFVLARGSVRVVREVDGRQVPLATLHDGAIFGEMALVSAQPRTATVLAADDCDLLEFDRDALRAAAQQVATIATALDKFTRERLLSNLLATAPLFRPLDRKQRYDLLRRFAAHDVAAGTHVIQEGQPGRGLYVLLSGEADVWKRDGEEKVLLATLGPGDVFGEIALLHEQTTTATVTAATQATVLFLSRELFQKLVQAVAEIRDYVESLGEERLMDTRLTMSSPDPIEELTDDDLILI